MCPAPPKHATPPGIPLSEDDHRIHIESEGATLEDLGSKNGTFVDGTPVRGAVPVANGSLIQVGSVELTLRVWSRGKAAETERIARRGDDRH